MIHTYSQLWIHFIWGTKDHVPSMPGPVKRKICTHIKSYGAEKGIYVDTINGTPNHLHALIGLKPAQSCSDVADLIKGESSHWVNAGRLTGCRFVWQDGFGVFSVSASQVSRVRAYIRNQEEHHKKMTFAEEVRLFCEKYGIKMGRP